MYPLPLHRPAHLRTGLALLLTGSMSPLSHAGSEATDVLITDPVVVTGAYAPTGSFDLPFSIDTVDLSQGNDGQLGVNLSEVLTKVPGLVV